MSDTDPTYLTPAEFARRLGVSRSTEHRWRQAGHTAPHHELPSGKVLYPEDKVEAWLDVHFREGGAPPRAADEAA